MKKIFLSLLVVLTACSANKNLHQKDSSKNAFLGTYEYVYPYNTEYLNENQFIVLTQSNDKLCGYYYGTSDEFDKAREGYLPAFFVINMEDLAIKADSIVFTLNVDNNDFLTKAVDLTFRSTNEAIAAGYKQWDKKLETTKKKYSGFFKDGKTIFFKGEQGVPDKTFNKK